VSADFQGARLSLAARTAQSYFELIEANLQTEAAEQSIKDRRTIVDLVRGRFSRGLTRGLDLRLVLTDLANAEAQLAKARNQVQIVTRGCIVMTTWWDDSQAYDERVRSLVEDGLGGFVLVCLVLSLFLQLRVAVWAGVGIFTSVLGALWLMPVLDVSLNILSLFGFLLAMGILVDDAIIIGESVYSHQEEGLAQDAEASLAAAISGVQAVALPVILSVSVALVAFLPGLFLPGWAGQMMKPICLVMILTLVFSLIEALLILPSHLVAPNDCKAGSSVLATFHSNIAWAENRCPPLYAGSLAQNA
jgi:multidrug efflux pump subunit AcrB